MKKIALLFAGQGSQYLGMGKSLYEQYQVFRNTYEEASDILKLDMRAMCYEGSMEQLSITDNTQPALLTYGVAAYRALMQEIGEKPVMGAGHSLGEVTALCCSGAVSFEDGLGITRLRAKLMQQCMGTRDYIMVAVRDVDKQSVLAVCSEAKEQQDRIEIACYNSVTQTVLVGYRPDALKVCHRLEKMGADIRIVNTSVPSHCTKMKEASEAFRQGLLKYSFKPFIWSVIANIDAMPYREPAEIHDKLALQLVRPVMWYDTMKYLQLQDIDLLIDIGPKNTMKKLALSDTVRIPVLSLDDRKDLHELHEIMQTPDSGASIKRIEKTLTAFMAKCMAIAASTKNNCYDQSEYCEGVIKPSKELRQIFLECGNGVEDCGKKVAKALKCLDSIMKTKRVPKDEFNTLMMEVKEAWPAEREC